MAIELKNSLHAAGSIAGATGARVSGLGFQSTRTGIGVYELVLDQGVDELECQIICTRRGSGTRASFGVLHVSDEVKRISVVGGVGAPFDSSFDFTITRN